MRELLQRLKLIFSNRLVLIGLVCGAMLLVLWINLFRLQILHRAADLTLVTNETYTRIIETESVRGSIYDFYGRPLAYNEFAWALYYDSSIRCDDLNALCHRISQLLSDYQITGDAQLAITYDPELGFSYRNDYQSSAVLRTLFLAEIYSKSSIQLTAEEKRTTAEQAYQFMHDALFEIDERYSIEEALEIMRFRYVLYTHRFQTETPILLAAQIPEDLRVFVSEHSSDFPTLKFIRKQHRVYAGGEAMAHITGYLAAISEEELDSFLQKGYDKDDLIGADGLEAVYEDLLRGQDGTVEYTYSASDDTLLDRRELTATVRGNDIYTTIDMDLQQKTYEALCQELKKILCDKITGESSSRGETYTASEVLEALINNGWMDPDQLLKKETPSAQSFSQSYERAAQVLEDRLRSAVLDPSLLTGDYDEELLHLYNTWIEIMRDAEGILDPGYREAGSFYEAYSAGEKSANEFLRYCLYNGYIDLNYYGLSHETDISVIIDRFLDAQLQDMLDNNSFQGLVYSYMLDNDIFSARQFLLMMYDCEILSNSDGTREKLEQGTMSPEDVLKAKISCDEITPADISLDPSTASAVVSDTDSGEVRAIASYPSFDNNRITSDAAYYSAIVSNASSPLLFRAVEELRAPGSTFKLCTAVTSLENGITDEAEFIYDEYTFYQANSAEKPDCNDYHGSVNVLSAIEVSCNYYFYTMGYRLCEPEDGEFEDEVGLKKMAYYSHELGLAEPTGLELSEAVPATSVQDAVRSAIGQGTNAYTIANINRYTSTIANFGEVRDLYLLDHIADAQDRIVYEASPVIVHKADVSEQTFDIVRRGMQQMAENTGSLRSFLEKTGFTVCGKTGTAQEASDRPSHAVFTAFVNPQDPEVTVSVIIPFGSASYRAIEAFVQIAEAYYDVN